MFSEAEREHIRERLLDRAREDSRITGAAITGSASHGVADRWSDIDLFFGVVAEFSPADVLGEWSEFMYRELGALHHFDLRSGAAIYRAFLLRHCLEVDLAFTPAAEFGASGPHFRTLFGDAVERPAAPPTNYDHIIGLSWHHILHARISIERNKLWQAEYWISAVRDHTLTLACLRLGLPANYAKGADDLPSDLLEFFNDTLVGTLTLPRLKHALTFVTALLLGEMRKAEPEVARRLENAVTELGTSIRVYDSVEDLPWRGDDL